MTASDGTLTLKQRRPVAALIASPTVEGVTQKTGVGRSNTYRWLDGPVFVDALRAAEGAEEL